LNFSISDFGFGASDLQILLWDEPVITQNQKLEEGDRNSRFQNFLSLFARNAKGQRFRIARARSVGRIRAALAIKAV